MLKRTFVALSVVAVMCVLSACEEVSVTQLTVATLEVDPESASLQPDQTVQLSATAFDASGSPLPGRTAEWTSLDPEVATVSGSGLARALSTGSARIRATIEGRSATATLQVGSSPQIALSQPAVQFSATAGGSTTEPVVVGVTNGGGGSLAGLGTSISWTQGPGGWLDATLSSTSAPSTLSLRATPGSLAPGSYEAVVTVTPSGAGASPGALTVRFQIREPNPAIGVSLGAVGFASSEGQGAPPSQTLRITNEGGGSLTGLEASISYASGDPSGWLSASLAGTSAPTELGLSVNPPGLFPGVYDAEIRITATGNTPPAVVQVRYRYGEAPPQFDISPGSLVRSAEEGASPLAPDTFRVMNAGTGILDGITLDVDYSGSARGWVNARLTSSQAPAQLIVTLDPDGLAAGTYEARASLTSAAAVNSPATVLLRLRVEPRVIRPSASRSTLGASPASVEPGQSSTLVVQLRDAEGNPMTSGGDPVFLTTTLGSLSRTSGTSEADGRFSATLTAEVAGPAEVAAYLGSSASDPRIGTATVTFLPPDDDDDGDGDGDGGGGAGGADAGRSTLEVDPGRFTTDETSQIEVRLRDAEGNDFEGQEEVFLVTTIGELDRASGSTDDDGEFEAELRSSTSGTGTVTAYLGTDATGPRIGSVDIRVDPGVASVEGSTLEVAATEVTAGSAAPIVVQLRDAAGNARVTEGDPVFLTTTLGSLSRTSGTSEADGRFTATLTSEAAGAAEVVAYLGSSASDPQIGTTTVTFLPPDDDDGDGDGDGGGGAGGADAGRSTLEVDPRRFSIDDDAEVEIQLRDANGRELEVEGIDIFLETTIGELEQSSGTSDDDGEFETELRSRTAGTGTVTAYLGTDATGPRIGSVEVQVDPGEASAEDSTIEATPSDITVRETSTIVVQLRDAAGNAVREEGEDIYLRTTGGRLSLTRGETDRDGRFVVTLRVNPSNVGTITITAWLDDDEDDDDRIGSVQIRVRR